VLQFGFGAVKGLQGPDLARFPGQHGANRQLGGHSPAKAGGSWTACG